MAENLNPYRDNLGQPTCDLGIYMHRPEHELAQPIVDSPAYSDEYVFWHLVIKGNTVPGTPAMVMYSDRKLHHCRG